MQISRAPQSSSNIIGKISKENRRRAEQQCFQSFRGGMGADESGLGCDLEMKLGFARGKQDNLELTFLRFAEHGPIDLHHLPIDGRVLDFERTGPSQLDSIVQDGAGGKAVGAEARAWVIDFEELNCRSGAIFDRGVHVIGVASGRKEKD
jgi:hypothetical protein